MRAEHIRRAGKHIAGERGAFEQPADDDLSSKPAHVPPPTPVIERLPGGSLGELARFCRMNVREFGARYGYEFVDE